MSGDFSEDRIDLVMKLMDSEADAKLAWRQSDRWQKLAGHYDDIRGWLRLCDDDPEGHAEFYKECCLLIFGEYRDESAGQCDGD